MLEYTSSLSNIYEALAQAGQPLLREMQVQFLLQGLPPKYLPYIAQVNRIPPHDNNFAFIADELCQFEKRIERANKVDQIIKQSPNTHTSMITNVNLTGKLHSIDFGCRRGL